ncbi:UNVERIFIED_CONTAM: hypothetical protein FKN15_002046 [Acipenser sinensis]
MKTLRGSVITAAPRPWLFRGLEESQCAMAAVSHLRGIYKVTQHASRGSLILLLFLQGARSQTAQMSFFSLQST